MQIGAITEKSPSIEISSSNIKQLYFRTIKMYFVHTWLIYAIGDSHCKRDYDEMEVWD
jgi:hypothetical protein